MGFWQRLLAGEPLEVHNPERLLPELLASHQEEVRLAQQFRVHADHAPHQPGAHGLRAAAKEQEQLVSWLRDRSLPGAGRAMTTLAPFPLRKPTTTGSGSYPICKTTW